MSKTPEQLAKERVDRQMAAINLEVPDRVPNGALMFSLGGDIAAEYGGITQREFSYDYDKALEAIEKYNRDFPFDVPGAAFMGLGNILGYAFADCKDLVLKVNRTTGPIHDVLRDRYTRFPGNEIGDHATPQFVGGTFMEADEYDQFTEDPFKFIAETLVPRVIRGIETPKSAMETWTKYGVEVERYQNAVARMVSTMQEQGYGLISVGSAIAPFDLIADNLRGVTNTVLDARRRPDKLKKACEALVEPIVNYALQSKRKNAEFVFIPLHMNEYLSPTLYKELYWPTLKEVIVRLFDNGMRSLVFFEGHHEQHLETILELPRGWGIAYFEKTDIVKAKEMLKDNCCVAGGLPISLVLSGTPERIDEYIKNLFEKVKPGGGFILLPSIGAAPIGTPLENIRAVINAVEKYGYY
jgi:uroporphyrinogen-III decarboxylase